MIEHSEFEKRLHEHILLSPAPGKHAARSALRHLERAWTLVESMPEVAIFLGITAEEESATAVFLSLQRRKYKDSNRLQIHSHVQKTALHPFLLGVGRVIGEFPEFNDSCFIFDTDSSPDKSEQLRLRFSVHAAEGLIYAMPMPPLNFSIRKNDSQHDFSEELSKLASDKNANNINDYIRQIANRRNAVLYASPKGIPYAENVTEFLKYRKSVVYSHLIAYLLVDQHREKQLFPQQCIDAFLKTLVRVPNKF